MNASKSILGGVAAVVLIAVLLGFAWRSQRVLESGLCPRTAARDQAHGLELALKHIVDHGGSLVPIAGTGSMAPFIPAASAGRDPRTTIVAYVVTVPGATFANITPGVPCIYWATWAGGHVIHGAAQQTPHGWIMSGLANARSESWEPMTAEAFKGIAAHVYTWRQL